MRHPLACTLLGHRWRFGVDGCDVVWRCVRGCEGGRRAYDDPAEARLMARRLGRGAPGPPLGLLTALSGTVMQRGTAIRKPRGENRT